MTELLPCPFCGSEALHYDNGYATCPKYRCTVNGLVVKNEEWNARAALAEDVRAVMPERKTTVGNSDSVNIRNDGWNACIDEFERINNLK